MSILSNAVYGSIRAGLRIPKSEAMRKFRIQSLTIDLLRELNVNCVLDVGANVGDFARNLRRLGYDRHLVCFEPIPEEVAKVREAAQGDDRWHVYDVALGATNEVRPFNVVRTPEAEHLTVLSSFRAPQEGLETDRVIDVQIRTLDDALPPILRDHAISDPTIFMKLDTQGFDLEVIEGAKAALENVVLLQTELSLEPLYEGMPHYTTALEQLERLGFSLLDLHSISRNEFGAVIEYDALLGRRSAFPVSDDPAQDKYAVVNRRAIS